MTSKKNPIGCTSVRCVAEAVRLSGKTLSDFFRQAMPERSVAELQGDVNAFEFLRKNSTPINSSYQIPKRVLDLASSIVNKKKSRIQKPPQKSFSPRSRLQSQQSAAA